VLRKWIRGVVPLQLQHVQGLIYLLIWQFKFIFVKILLLYFIFILLFIFNFLILIFWISI
jgi:hypothetical protein